MSLLAILAPVFLMSSAQVDTNNQAQNSAGMASSNRCDWHKLALPSGPKGAITKAIRCTDQNDGVAQRRRDRQVREALADSPKPAG